MAIFKIKRFSHLDKADLSEAIEKFDDFTPSPDKNSFIGVALGIGIIASIIFAISKFFKSKSGSGKYKATQEEIDALRPEFPKEYSILKNIQYEITQKCRYIFRSNSSMDFYINTLPSLLNVNGEEFITGWARETGKERGIRWAPIFVMYNASYIGCYDFDKKYWFFIIGNKEYTLKNSLWDALKYEFEAFKKTATERLFDSPDLLKEVLDYLNTNLKLIKKYGKV